MNEQERKHFNDQIVALGGRPIGRSKPEPSNRELLEKLKEIETTLDRIEHMMRPFP